MLEAVADAKDGKAHTMAMEKSAAICAAYPSCVKTCLWRIAGLEYLLNDDVWNNIKPFIEYLLARVHDVKVIERCWERAASKAIDPLVQRLRKKLKDMAPRAARLVV